MSERNYLLLIARHETIEKDLPRENNPLEKAEITQVSLTQLPVDFLSPSLPIHFSLEYMIDSYTNLISRS